MARRKPPTIGPDAPGDQWQMDPRDVQRYARRMRETQRASPLGRFFRYAAVAVLVVAVWAVYWNFETLTGLRFDFSRLTTLLGGANREPAGARPADGEPGTEVVDGGGVAGVSLPSSIQRDEAEAPAADAPADDRVAAVREPVAVPPAPQAEPERAAPADAVRAAPEPQPVPPPEPEVPPRPETMGFGLERMSVSEADASAAVLVLRDGGRRGVSAFTWWTTDGTANAGADFARLDRRVERFTVGEQNRTLHVPIIGDRSREGPETFFVHVVAGETADAADTPVAQIEVVINDDD